MNALPVYAQADSFTSLSSLIKCLLLIVAYLMTSSTIATFLKYNYHLLALYKIIYFSLCLLCTLCLSLPECTLKRLKSSFNQYIPSTYFLVYLRHNKFFLANAHRHSRLNQSKELTHFHIPRA